MSTGKIPGPYVNDVKRDDSLMEYTNLDTMDIGARPSGLPKGGVNGMKSIQHVGDSDGKRGGEPKYGRTAKG
jgi:hypothetical protein